MKTSIWICVLWSGAAAWAADVQTLAVKPGQWEVTHVTESSGPPPIPPDVLAKMTPDQKARMEAAMKARQGTRVTKSCVTKEQLAQSFNLGNQMSAGCKHDIIKSTSTRQEVHFECGGEAMKNSGSVIIEALSPESIKGTIQATVSNGGNTMNIHSTFTGKWLSAACTEAK